MKTKQLIKWIVKNNINLEKEMVEVYTKLSEDRLDEAYLANKFDMLFSKYSNHPLIIKSFLDFLQLVNDKKLLDQFTHNDLTNLYKSSIVLNEYDLEFCEDYLQFLVNVVNDEGEVSKFKEKIQKIISKTEKAIDSIL